MKRAFEDSHGSSSKSWSQRALSKLSLSTRELNRINKKMLETRERNKRLKLNIAGEEGRDDNREIQDQEVEEAIGVVGERQAVLSDHPVYDYFQIDLDDEQIGVANPYRESQADEEGSVEEHGDEEDEDGGAVLEEGGLEEVAGVGDEEDDDLVVGEGDVIMERAANNDKEDDTEFQPDPNDEFGYDQMSLTDLYKKLPDFLTSFPGFDIGVYSRQAAKKAMHGYGLPSDYDEALWPQHPDLRKGDFYRSLNRSLTKHKVVDCGRKDLLCILQRYIPDINLPAAKQLPLYDRFQENDYIKFHICIGGCMVYAGDNRDKYRCEVCNCDRLRKCRQCQAVDLCTHKDRVPWAVVRYRSLIGMLIKLITSYPKFVDLLAYVNESHLNDDAWISDLANAKRYGDHVNEMQQIYQTKMENKLLPPGTKSICLLLGQFYDGAQIFKTKVVSFWPIFIQILSLPPHLRTQIGIGFFVLTLIALSSFSNIVERFVLHDCFVGELRLLNIGVHFTHKGTSYFLQARLVLHALDTKGMEPLLMVQATNARAGCPLCSLERAVYRTQIKKACIVEHRRHLPLDHLLRSIGQSKFCCPPDYYGLKEVEQVPLVTDHKPKFADVTNKITGNSFNYRVCQQEKLQGIFNPGSFLRDVSKGYNKFTWYHDENTVDLVEALQIFRGGLYYPHCNYAPQLHHKRRKNIEYLRSGLYVYSMRADQTNKYYAEYKEAVNGVKGIWPFALLDYATIEDVTWDPFHILKNNMLNIIANFKGERLQKDGKYSEFCKLQQCHPSMYIKDIAHPWELDDHMQEKIDSFLACLIFPYGCSEERDMLYPFARTGLMKGHGLVQLLSDFMDYMLLAIDKAIPEAYRRFLSMLSYDVSQMLNPVIKRSDIDTLYNQVLETICVKEGLYPETEALFPYHQLIDVVQFIKLFGPVRGWWTFAGERAIGVLKRCAPQGGTSYDQTTFNRYLKVESLKTSQYYKRGDDILVEDDKEDEEDERYFRKTADSKYVFNAYPSILHKPVVKHDQCNITVFDLAQILACLMNEIELHSSDVKTARKDSPLYYLTTFYKKHINSSKTGTLQAFIIWIKDGLFLTWQLQNPEKIRRGSIDNDTIEEVTLSWESEVIYPECVRLATELINLRVYIYQHATVLGVRFKSRGWEYREYDSPIVEIVYGREYPDITPSNECNKLVNHWAEREHYSSWCAMKVSPPYTKEDLLLRKDNSIKFGENAMKGRVYLYGQLNAFLKVHMPADRFIHGMCIASVTARCYSDENFVDTISVDDKISFVSNRGYVPLSYILPTHIALAGFLSVGARSVGKKRFEAMDLPVNIQVQGGKRNDWYVSSKWKHKAYKLVMINIDRSRGSCLKAYYDEHGREYFTVQVNNGRKQVRPCILKVK